MATFFRPAAGDYWQSSSDSTITSAADSCTTAVIYISTSCDDPAVEELDENDRDFRGQALKEMNRRWSQFERRQLLLLTPKIQRRSIWRPIRCVSRKILR